MATIKEVQKNLQKYIDTIAKCPLFEGELSFTQFLTCKEESWKEIVEGMKILSAQLKMPHGFKIYDENAVSNGKVEIRFGLTKDYAN